MPPPTTYCEVSPTMRRASGLTRQASNAWRSISSRSGA